jgi:anti-sigma factor RsiW
MSCEEWREDVSAWLDGELSARRRVEVDAHLKSCRDCRRLTREFQELARLAKRVPVPGPRPELGDAAMALVRARRLRVTQSWRVAPQSWGAAQSWRPKMFWPQFSLAAAGLAIAGFLAFLIVDHENPGFFGAGNDQKLASGHSAVPPSAPSANPTPTASPDSQLATASPTAAAPPIVGSLIVDNSGAGAERLETLARSLGGNTDLVTTSGQSTVYVSIPQNARGQFQARLREIGNWQSAPSVPIGDETVGIRIIQRP